MFEDCWGRGRGRKGRHKAGNRHTVLVIEQLYTPLDHLNVFEVELDPWPYRMLRGEGGTDRCVCVCVCGGGGGLL